MTSGQSGELQNRTRRWHYLPTQLYVASYALYKNSDKLMFSEKAPMLDKNFMNDLTFLNYFK